MAENRETGGCGGLLLAAVLLAGLGGLLLFAMGGDAASPVELAGYATSLRGRTDGQRHNAQLAARALNNRVVPPGAVFSFNKTVKSWSWDQGYKKAPVSYDGELVRAYGGGVCQTSTTLYNAVLLAGLPVLERHPHVFAPHYVPPGRDAAVAQYDIDLRFRNPHPWPLTLRARAEGDRLEVRLFGAERPKGGVEVRSETLSVTRPNRLTRVACLPGRASGRAYVRNPGATGGRVVTTRVFTADGRETRRERLGDDTYQAMNRLVLRTEDERPRP